MKKLTAFSIILIILLTGCYKASPQLLHTFQPQQYNYADGDSFNAALYCFDKGAVIRVNKTLKIVNNRYMTVINALTGADGVQRDGFTPLTQHAECISAELIGNILFADFSPDFLLMDNAEKAQLLVMLAKTMEAFDEVEYTQITCQGRVTYFSFAPLAPIEPVKKVQNAATEVMLEYSRRQNLYKNKEDFTADTVIYIPTGGISVPRVVQMSVVNGDSVLSVLNALKDNDCITASGTAECVLNGNTVTVLVPDGMPSVVTPDSLLRTLAMYGDYTVKVTGENKSYHAPIGDVGELRTVFLPDNGKIHATEQVVAKKDNMLLAQLSSLLDNPALKAFSVSSEMLHDVVLEGDCAVIDMKSELPAQAKMLDEQSEMLLFYSIVNTLTSVPAVKRVRFLENGCTCAFFGNIMNTEEPVYTIRSPEIIK